MQVKKQFHITLDVKRPTSNREFAVMWGDNGNVITIALTDDGQPINLTDCLVMVVFARPDGAIAEQDTDNHGVTLDEEQPNVIHVELYTGSVTIGLVDADVQIFSGENRQTLISSARFNFNCVPPIANSKTIPAINEWPLLVDMLDQVKQGEQTRQTAEEIRQTSETIRQTNEADRIQRDTAFSTWEEYNPGKAYIPLNKVSYQGSSYLCIGNTQGNAPPNPSYWLLIASKGDKGKDGTGTGDMEKEIYDADDNGIVDDAERLGGQLPTAYLSQSFTATLTLGDWSADAPYTQTVEVTGITDEMQPLVDIVLSPDLEVAKAEETNWGYASKIDTGAGEITATCNSMKPTVDLHIRLKEVP